MAMQLPLNRPRRQRAPDLGRSKNLSVFFAIAGNIFFRKTFHSGPYEPFR